MTFKAITGSYPAGYYLNPAHQTLDIGPAAYVGGAGVTTTDSQPSTIHNLGVVVGARDGVTLADGGRITNGGGTLGSTLISGVTPIVVNQGAGVLVNRGSIVGANVVNGFYSTTYLGVALNAGGEVRNAAGAYISSGVSIAGSRGTVANDGRIGSSSIDYYYGYGAGRENDRSESRSSSGISVVLNAGGAVVNGPSTTASLQGIDIMGGSGTVLNAGKIDSPSSSFEYSSYFGQSQETRSADSTAVVLVAGGRVVNGSSADTAASIGGVGVYVRSGTVINFGIITGSTSASYYNLYGGPFHYSAGRSASNGYSVVLDAGGRIENGSASDVKATLSYGVEVLRRAGVVINNGVIGGESYSEGRQPAFGYGFSSEGCRPSVVLKAGGTVTNGVAGNTVASMTNGVEISGGLGEVLNEGTIGHATSQGTGYSYGYGYVTTTSDGYSVVLDAAGTIVNGSVSDGGALVQNGVGVSGGDGRVTNFGTIEVETVGTDGPLTGIDLGAGGVIINGSLVDTSAEISGPTGIIVAGGAAVTNYGTIASSSGAAGTAIAFGVGDDDTLREEASGVLIGGVQGGGGKLDLEAAAGAGVIAGVGGSITGFARITVEAGAGWTFSGPSTLAAGVTLDELSAIAIDGTLTNDGAFDAAALTVLASDGELDNAAGGRLYLEKDVAIAPAAGATGASFLNAGVLDKADGAGVSGVRVNLTDTGRIVVADGALEIAGAENTIAGAIVGPGTIDFRNGATTLDAGTTISAAAWELTGAGASLTVTTSLAYAHAFTATGQTTLTVESGDTLALDGAVGGAGALDIGAGATLAFASTVAAASRVNFVGAGSVLELADAAAFKAAVAGFAAGETIDLRAGGFGAGTTIAYSGTSSSGVLTLTDGAHRARIALLGQYAAADFVVAGDGHGGADITFAAAGAPALATPGR